METVAFCEIDEYCRKVLRKHWPDVPIHEDIKELNGEQYKGAVDVVCGGFPCQPFSSAGNQRGRRHDSFLWPEMLRVISEARPNWVIGENVIGFKNMELENCISDMEALSYDTWAVVIPACAVGAAHIRERVWILGHTDNESEPTVPVYDEAPRLQGLFADTDCEQVEWVAESWRKCFFGSNESPVYRGNDGIPNRMDRLKALGS
jgi:DNA (cytosine-5)-methyltransferase 1